MRIGGVEIVGDLAKPNEDILVIPRKGSQIVFTARALESMEEFDTLCPQPTPPKMFKKDEGWVQDVEDPTFANAAKEYAERRVAYFVVGSLQDIEWSTVERNQPNTWKNWEDDLKGVGFTPHECNLVLTLCFQVNQLSETKLKEARDLFILGQERAAKESSTQSSEQNDTQSGERASESE